MSHARLSFDFVSGLQEKERRLEGGVQRESSREPLHPGPKTMLLD